MPQTPARSLFFWKKKGENDGFLQAFDIIGPRMIGPSSSHTAGAARLGNVASRILGNQVRTAEITLYGSFAQTGQGPRHR